MKLFKILENFKEEFCGNFTLNYEENWVKYFGFGDKFFEMIKWKINLVVKEMFLKKIMQFFIFKMEFWFKKVFFNFFCIKTSNRFFYFIFFNFDVLKIFFNIF